MSGPTPVELLEAEHRVIQKMVAAMSVLAERLDGGEDLDVSLLENIVEFLRTFADRCHHGKEETLCSRPWNIAVCRHTDAHLAV